MALDVADVQFSKGAVYVRAGKGGRERYVPLAPGVAEDLRGWLIEGRPELLGTSSSPSFFIGQRGTRPQGQTLALRLKGLLDTAGITKTATLHTLRHSIATHLLAAGMPLEAIQRFLGHASLESTQIYTHLKEELVAGEAI